MEISLFFIYHQGLIPYSLQEVYVTSLKFSANQHSTVSEKTWMSNHLPMAWQRQHILFKYLKTHSVGLVWSGLELEPSTLSHHDLAPLKPEFTWNKQKFTTFLEYPCSTKTLLVSSSSQLSTLYLKWNIPDFSFLENYWQNSTTSKKKYKFHIVV